MWEKLEHWLRLDRYARWVRWLIPALIFLVITWRVYANNGLFDSAMFAFPVLLLVSGLLLGLRGLGVFTILTIGIVGVVGYKQISAPTPFLYSDYATVDRLIAALLAFAAIGGLAAWVINNLLQSLHRLQESETSLSLANQELRNTQKLLEEQVAERTHGIERARREAELARKAIEAQAWLATGQSQLNDAMRGEQDIQILADNILRHLCQYLGGQVGVFYIHIQGNLRRIGGFAFTPDSNLPDQFALGEGLIGQAAVGKEILLLEEIPETQIRINSSLGSAPPKSIVLIPLLYNNDLVGVIEIGSLKLFRTEHLNYLVLAATSIAVTLQTTLARMRVNDLLVEMQSQAEELQAQAEEMRAQEEELRAVNEELLAQTESLRAKSQS